MRLESNSPYRSFSHNLYIVEVCVEFALINLYIVGVVFVRRSFVPALVINMATEVKAAPLVSAEMTPLLSILGGPGVVSS